MAKSILYMSMSLDGFITGPNDGPGTVSATTASGCTSGSENRYPRGRTSTLRG